MGQTSSKTACVSIKQALSGEIAADSNICLQGWVRTRRDSKAGFSFINLHDGSCFHPIQLVADKDLPNYAEEILRLTAGCSLRCHGKLVEYFFC